MSERHTDPLDILSDLEQKNLRKNPENIFDSLEIDRAIVKEMAKQLMNERDRQVLEEILGRKL